VLAVVERGDLDAFRQIEQQIAGRPRAFSQAQRQVFAEAAPEALMQDREFDYGIAQQGKQVQRRSASRWMAGPENPSTGAECNPPAGTP
jgi:hypothetical protein